MSLKTMIRSITTSMRSCLKSTWFKIIILWIQDIEDSFGISQCLKSKGVNFWDLKIWGFRACSHGGGGPQVGEVPRLSGVTNLSIQSLFFSWLLSHERWGTSPRQICRSAMPGNPLRWGKFFPCECWRWGGVMFIWAFIHYKTNWKADCYTTIRPCLV